MTTMKLTLKKKLRSLVGVVACNGSLAAWAVEEILELFLKEKTVVANECIAALDDIKNYDRILALLGMQEEGDPVAWVESHLAKGAQDARKAFALDALVAAGLVTQAKADESLAIADQAMLSQRGEVE